MDALAVSVAVSARIIIINKNKYYIDFYINLLHNIKMSKQTYKFTYNLDGQVVTSPKVYPTERGAKIAVKRETNKLTKAGRSVSTLVVAPVNG